MDEHMHEEYSSSEAAWMPEGDPGQGCGDEQFARIERSDMEAEAAAENATEGLSPEPFKNALLGSLANELVRNVSELHRTAFEALGANEETALEAVCGPTERLQCTVRPGDVLQRVIPGEAVYSAIVVSEEPEDPVALARRGIPVERGVGGACIEVVELAANGGEPYCAGRRLTDANGYLPYGQRLLRANLHGEQFAELDEQAILPAAPVDRWCQVRQTIADTARAELRRWQRPDGTNILESVNSQLQILRSYWRAVPGRGSNAESLRMATLSAADHIDGPWSAAFICYVMQTAGVQAAQGFVFGGKHISYIVGALRNRENSARRRPFWLLDSEEMQVQEPGPGDLLCFNRRYRDPDTRQLRWTNHSYSSLRRQFWPLTRRNRVPWGHSHCALVVGQGVENGRPVVYTIGGNEANSVRQRQVALNQQGGVLNPAQARMFGMIKITRC